VTNLDYQNPQNVERPIGEAEAALLRWIDRMDRLIDAETHALLSGARVDFDSFNSKKNYALLEFRIMSRNFGDISQDSLAQLKRLNGRLAQNGEVLKQHLQAVSEISKLIITSIRAEESDGTYSRRASLGVDERRR